MCTEIAEAASHTTPSVLLRRGLSEHVKRLIIQRVFLWSVSQPRLHLFIREDTRQFCEINNSAVVKGIRNDEPKLYHFLNSCIIDESKKSLWYHFQRRFRSMTQKTIWIVWKGMWVAVNMCTVWSLCMANRICDKFWWDFFFFFFFAVCPRNVNLSLPSHPESGLYGFPCIHWFLFLKYLSSGWGGVRAVPQGSDPPVGGGEGLCWNSQTARCLYPETQIHEVYDPLHLQSEKWESGLWETLSGCAKDSSHKSHTRDCSLICSLILYITKNKTLMVTIHGWLQALFNHTRHCLPGNRSGLFFLSPKKKKLNLTQLFAFTELTWITH